MKKGKRKQLNLSTMIVLIISAFSIVTSTVLGTILTTVSVVKMKNMVSKKSLELANTAATMLDGDSLKNLTADDINGDAYKKAYTTLEQFKISNNGTSGELAYIYACRSTGDGHFEFIIDPSEDPAGFGEDLEWTAALESASKGEPAFDTAPYTDRWGTFYSAYAPVFDSNHEVVMVVGIDVWADWYNDTVWSNSRYIIIVAAISVASGILVGVLISLRIRKRFETLSKDYSELENDVQILISEIKEPMNLSDDDIDEESNSKDQIMQLKQKIHTTQKEIKEYIIYTQKQAYVDALSRVGNRAAYLERIKNLGDSTFYTLILADINGLKYINDHYGHDSGDRTIVIVSELLQEVFYKEDIFRIGGDEFVVLLTDNNKKATLDVYNSLDKKFIAFNEKKELPFLVHISKGIAFYDKFMDKSPKDVFNRADENMYHNKEDFYNKNPELKKKYRR